MLQGNRPVDDGIVGGLFHIGVHVGICQTEDHGLVAHQRLVVAFYISHRVLTGTAQTHISPHLIDVPELILGLGGLDPHVRKSHSQAVIKADAAIFDRQAHAGHTGHIFRDGDGIGFHLPDQFIRQLQIGDCVNICVHGEVLIVGIEVCPESMIMIEH